MVMVTVVAVVPVVPVVKPVVVETVGTGAGLPCGVLFAASFTHRMSERLCFKFCDCGGEARPRGELGGEEV